MGLDSHEDINEYVKVLVEGVRIAVDALTLIIRASTYDKSY